MVHSACGDKKAIKLNCMATANFKALENILPQNILQSRVGNFLILYIVLYTMFISLCTSTWQ